MSTFANRFDKGAAGVVDDDMDDKMIPSNIKVGAEADKEWDPCHYQLSQRLQLNLAELSITSDKGLGGLIYLVLQLPLYSKVHYYHILWGCQRGSIAGNRR